MSTNSPIEKLAAWLDAVGAQPDITPERLAPSTVYDLEYRVLIVAMAFRIHAAPDKFSSRPRIQSRRLKLLQFVAMRPWLVSVIREWSLSRRDVQRSLTEEGLRRGFISDTMHDDVVDFLVGAGALRREELYVVPGTSVSVMFDLYSEAVERRTLFDAELTALGHLKSIVITNEMLEGW